MHKQETQRKVVTWPLGQKARANLQYTVRVMVKENRRLAKQAKDKKLNG